MATRELTGRKVFIIAVAAFAVILAANLTMMFAATGTFPGLVVKNSYVASQGWDARAREQEALGWAATAAIEEGALSVALTDREGRALSGLAVEATVGRPATQVHDRVVRLAASGDRYAAPVELAPGLWRVEVRARDADGRSFEVHAELFVKGAS